MAEDKNLLGNIAQGAGAVTGVLGMIQSIGAAKRQQKRNKELMDIQFRNQQSLNRQQAEQSKEMWDYTNYENQVEHMEKAGLNVGMLYGGSGGGGATTAGTSAGSASGGGGGAAEQIVNGRDMTQLAMTSAQMNLMNAQADKAKAEAENLRGADRENTVADTAFKQMQTENQKIINNVGNQTIEEQVMGIKANADKAQSEARKALVEANVNEKTQKEQEKKIKSDAITAAIEAAVKQSQIDVNKAQIENWAEQIKIGKFNANREAEFQGMDKVKGAMLNKALNYISDKLGVRKDTETQDKIE